MTPQRKKKQWWSLKYSTSTVPEVEDPGDQRVQHNGEEQRDDVEDGEVNEVDGQVKLAFHSVATLDVSIWAYLKIQQNKVEMNEFESLKTELKL